MKRITFFTPIIPIIIPITLLFSSQAVIANEVGEGEKLYKTHCTACHGATGGMDMSKRIAPPIAGVRKHYMDVHPEKQAFVAAVSGWLEKQDASKSLMRGAIQRFKIMPPLVIAKTDAEKIATYIYEGEIDKPAGFDEHVAMMHGNKMHGNHMKEHQGMPNNVRSMMAMKGMKAQMMMKQLNLSPEQQQKMPPLIQKKKEVMVPLKKKIQHINQQIQSLDTSNPDYKSKIFSLADEKGRLVHRMVIEKGEMRMKIESVLTTEQRKKFAELRAKKRTTKQRMKHMDK